jgi:hypothetical protein
LKITLHRRRGCYPEEAVTMRIGRGGGFRTHAEQARLHAQKPGLAARPGHSMHEVGLARDLTYGPGGSEWAHKHAPVPKAGAG